MKCHIPTIAFAVLITFALASYAQEATAGHEDVLPVISNMTISPDTVHRSRSEDKSAGVAEIDRTRIT